MSRLHMQGGKERFIARWIHILVCERRSVKQLNMLPMPTLNPFLGVVVLGFIVAAVMITAALNYFMGRGWSR